MKTIKVKEESYIGLEKTIDIAECFFDLGSIFTGEENNPETTEENMEIINNICEGVHCGEKVDNVDIEDANSMLFRF